MSQTESRTVATPYDRHFYENQVGGSGRSAHIVLGMLFDHMRPSSVVDVGCGEGPWLAAALQMGVHEVLGLDGDYVDRARLKVPADCFLATDLSRPFEVARRFDMAICMEVAEHLDPSAAESFIASIVKLAPVVLFSAAAPGQGGTDHRNEQWPSYWAALFRKHQYMCFDALRPKLWHDDRIDVWYRQNVLLFVSSGHPLANDSVVRANAVDRPMDAIHRELVPSREWLLQRLYWAEHPGVRTATRSLFGAFMRAIRGIKAQ